ncbi:MAG: TraB/GumN family protein [Chitinophagales bacterium]
MKSFLCVLFLVCSFCVAQAQNTGYTGSLLWKVSGNGLATPSYIYGTIHLLEQSDFKIKPEVDSVFDAADKIIFEVDLTDITLQSTFQNWMLLPDNKSIKDYCSADEFNKISKYCTDSLKVDISAYANQKPFAIYQLQTTHLIKGELASFELYFLQKCMRSQIPVGGLETLNSQLHIFDSISYEEQLDWIVASIDSSDEQYINFDNMVASYLSGDLNALLNLMETNSPEIKKYDDLFLVNRNKNWIPVIMNEINKQSSFIAVGAAHLGGPTGILQLLANKGYTITPL